MGFPFQAVTSPQRALMLLSLTKTGGGTPVLGGLCANFCSVVDNGTGDYTIFVNEQEPFWQVVQAVATPHDVGFVHIDTANTTKLKVTLKCYDVDGTTPADLDFDLVVIGCTAKDLLG